MITIGVITIDKHISQNNSMLVNANVYRRKQATLRLKLFYINSSIALWCNWQATCDGFTKRYQLTDFYVGFSEWVLLAHMSIYRDVAHDAITRS